MPISSAVPSKARKAYARLDRELILDAALRIAARPETESVTFRELGVELDADHTAVYRHFQNKEEITDALIDRVMQLVADQLTRSPQDDWRAALHDGAVAFYDVFLRYPALAARVADTRNLGVAELALVEQILEAFFQSGLRGDELLQHYSAYSGLVLSFTAMTAQKIITQPGNATPESWVPGVEGISPTTHPRLSELGEAFFSVDARETCLRGVAVILDAAEAASR